jgi:hypothetical protein
LDAAAQSAIADYVTSGGSLIIHGDGSSGISLLNGLFGFALSILGYASSQLDAAVAAGTPFEGGPASLPDPSYTPGVARSSLPAGALDLYHDTDSNYVFTVPFGAGQITRLGWDWFNAVPLGSEDGGWIEVLGRAVGAVGNGDPSPCDCVIQGGPNEELKAWINGGPTYSGDEQLCMLGQGGGSGHELCGADILFQLTGVGEFERFEPAPGMDTLVYKPDCVYDEEAEQCLLPAGTTQIRMNFLSGLATPGVGPRSLGSLFVNSTGLDENTSTTVTAFGEAAGANLQERPIASSVDPEVVATSDIPEPGRIVQLVSGLFGLGFLYRLRRRS